MNNLVCLATLPRLRARQGLNQPTLQADTSDDFRLLQKIRAASRDIEEWSSTQFYPTIDTRKFDWEHSYKLTFRDQDVLQLTSIVDGQNQTIDLTAVIPIGAPNVTYGPFYSIELDPSKGLFTYYTTKTRAISVTGVFGFHDNYAPAATPGGTAWHDSNVTLSGGINNAVTSLATSANDSSITDDWGQQWPSNLGCGTVHVGHLIQIDSEMMFVVGYTASTTLKVVRGVLGSTAAAHLTGAHIYIYEPPQDIQDMCTEYAAYLFLRDSTDTGKITIDAMGNKTVALNVPGTIKDRVQNYRHRSV